MPIVSAVVEIEPGASEMILGRLAGIREVSVYGMKENHIVVVIESRTMEAAEEALNQVRFINDVIRAYPVFVGQDE